MQHQKSQPAISANEVPVADLASNTDLKFKHCAEMAAAADSASQVDSDIAETSVMFTGMDCDCSTGCSLTAPAVISNVEVSLNQHPSGDIVMFSRYSVVESFRSRLYRPPIA